MTSTFRPMILQGNNGKYCIVRTGIFIITILNFKNAKKILLSKGRIDTNHRNVCRDRDLLDHASMRLCKYLEEVFKKIDRTTKALFGTYNQMGL